MINPVNPYCAFPFFDADYTEIRTVPLNSPLASFPPICFKVTGTGLSATWKLRDYSDESLTTVGAGLLNVIETDEGETYVTYEGGAHSLTLTNGREYQLQITIDSTIYYSHSFIACAAFETIDSTVIIDDTDLGLGPDEWSMDLAFNDTAGAGTRVLSYRATSSDPWTRLGINTGTVTSDNVTGTGTVTFEVKGIVYLGSVRIERIYTASILTSDPLNTFTFVLKRTINKGVDNLVYLEWENTNDLQAYNLYYQGSFKNRFYFEGQRGFVEIVEEDTFEENGAGELIFDSSSRSQQIPIEVEKVSEFLPLAFSGAKIHDTVTLVRSIDGDVEAIRQFTLNFEQNTENNFIPSGIFTYERDYGFVGGCQENETVV